MAFLIPALLACLLDLLLLYLSCTATNAHLSHPTSSIYSTTYLVPLSVLRLVLLFTVLPYHSYTGTAVKCPVIYRLFFGGTVLAVLMHMLILSMLDPNSIRVWMATTTTTTSILHGTRDGQQYYNDQQQRWLFQSHHDDDFYQRRHVWLLLTFSIASSICHWIMLQHVTSTAPDQASALDRRRHHILLLQQRQRRKSQPLFYYYASKRWNFHRQGGSSSNYGNGGTTNGRLEHPELGALLPNQNNHPKNGNHHHTQNDNGDTEAQRTHSQHGDGNGDTNHLMELISSHSYEFVMDLQSKLQIAKRQWAQRLDDFTSKITSPNHNNNNHSNSNVGDSHHHAFSKLRRAGSGGRLNHALSPLTPFRVLLQLFAYEEVLDNGRLDSVYFMDDGDAMTFFVPQLLNFLLYGAYESGSIGLEEWILDKCRRNAFFAHRCFWYLRAWCLHLPAQLAPPPKRESSQPSLVVYNNGNNNNNNNNGGGQQPSLLLSDPPPFRRSMSNGSLTVKNFLRAGDDTTTISLDDSMSLLSFSSRGGGGGNKNQNLFSHQQPPSQQQQQQQQQQNHPNLLPEERAVLEALMFRVMECGEESSRILQFGITATATIATAASSSGLGPDEGGDESLENPTGPMLDMSSKSTSSLEQQQQHRPPPFPSLFAADHSSSNACISPSAIMMAAESGSIPVDPDTGYPSMKHLDVLCATQKFGFLPLLHNKTNNNNNRPRRANGLSLPPVIPGTGPPADILRRLSNDDEGPDVESWFEATPRFLDALIALADNLLLIPREKRQKELRKQLQSLEVELLPCNAIYVPVNNTHHRVWRIVAEESIAISTKERVPCIICLEVVNYTPNVSAPPKRQSILEKVKTSLRSKVSLDEGRSTATHSDDDSATAQNSAHTPFPLPSQSHLTEKEIVYQWRTEKRDPRRGESIIGKVTHTVREGINKIPLDSVRETMTKISDARSIHDMLHMTAADLDIVKNGEDLDEKITGKTKASDNDIETGVAAPGGKPPSGPTKSSRQPHTTAPLAPGAPVTPVPRGSHHRGTPAHMGQWLTPSPGRSLGVNNENGLQSLVTIRRKMESLNDTPESLSPYGSTTEGPLKGSVPLRPSKSNVEVSPTARSNTPNRAAAAATAPVTKPPPVVFKECWKKKEERIRSKSAYGSHPGWRLLPILIKSNDDLRQEQLAYQLIYRMAYILARERVPVWLCPYEIIALTDRGGIIEAIPDTISLDSLRRNDPDFTGLKNFFRHFFGEDTDEYADAKSNFVESLAAYSVVCFLLQIKDRHNGNILLDNRGHLIHIDFGFFFLSSPGKNTGFESAPFKLTRDFCDLLDGPDSHTFRHFKELCSRTFLALRRHCDEIILLVEMMMNGNEDLKCFRGRPEDAVRGLRERFRLDLNDRACVEYVNFLVEESMENWRTDWYDRYQRYCVGIL